MYSKLGLQNNPELRFTYYPDPLLRQKAEPIEGKPTNEILSLLKQIKRICVEREGLGLAAQQVGIVAPVIVVNIPKENRTYNLVGVINPHIIEQDRITIVREEGCLSLPGLYFPVERPCRIVAEGWFDDVGKLERREFIHIAARTFCHESDHINGILFIDHIGEDARRRIKPELQRIAHWTREHMDAREKEFPNPHDSS